MRYANLEMVDLYFDVKLINIEKGKKIKNREMSALHGVPKRSPIQVLTTPDGA